MAKKPTVLIVDDEEDFHVILRRILERMECRVVSAMTAEEALRMLEALVPDVAFVDWNLPGMNGVEFIKKVRADKRTRGMKLIMLTVRSNEEDQLAAYSEKVDLYMNKPVEPEIILEKVKGLLSA
ncbi:MAG: response regulator [Elusimicrobiales bacterium]|nr:response regulator [Elusimicrobiales bacterium]